MSELIFTSSAYIIPGDSPMTSVANTVQVAMTTLAVHTLQPLIFYNWKMNSPERSNIQVAKAPWTLRQKWCDWWTRRRAAPRRLRLRRRRGARGPTRSPPAPSTRQYTGFASTNCSSPGSRRRRRDRRKTCQMDVEAVRYVLPLQRSRFFASKRGGMAKCSSSY